MFFTMVMSKWQSDSKRAETRLFLNLDSKSEIFVCRQSFKALNAPKFNLTPEARLKAKNVVFGAKISRPFHFQISKKARLKKVTKTKALTCAMRLYDSNQASPMISSHFDKFRALNAPFFFHHRFHVFAIWAKKSNFLSNFSQMFFFSNF